MKPIVLCRPQGGLNDMLNQMELCFDYAQRHNRYLIVDTDYRNSGAFRDNFSRYFLPRDGRIILENPISDRELDGNDVFPAFISGRVSTYSTRWSDEAMCYLEQSTQLPITFDFQKSYAQPILVHHQCGGGIQSAKFAQRIQLRKFLIELFEYRRSKLPKSYAAIHVRNTDLKTDYQRSIATVGSQGLPHLFVATDSQQVLNDFRAGLPQTVIHSLADLSAPEGKPLHYGFPRPMAVERNIDAIMDLLLLAFGEPLMLIKTTRSNGAYYSGFSRLAAALNRHPKIVQNLLGRRPA